MIDATPIDSTEAAAGLTRCADVSGFSVEILARGKAYRLTTPTGSGVFVLNKNGRELWVQAGEGADTSDLTKTGLMVIENLAVAMNCDYVAFETRRRGLVKKASEFGYDIRAYIMQKEVV